MHPSVLPTIVRCAIENRAALRPPLTGRALPVQIQPPDSNRRSGRPHSKAARAVRCATGVDGRWLGRRAEAPPAAAVTAAQVRHQVSIPNRLGGPAVVL